MENTENVTLGIESTTSMVEQLGNAFDELEANRESSLLNRTLWKDIKEHFCNLKSSLTEKLGVLEEKGRILEQKQSETRTLLAEREAAVSAKENALLDRLEELKDAAVSAIVEARKNCKVQAPMLVNAKGSKESKVSTSVNDDTNATTPAAKENTSDNKSVEPAEAIAGEVKPRPELQQLCEQMDVKGLLKFISDNKKNFVAIREELSIALKSATEPARLVLDSLEGFFPPDPSSSQVSEDSALQGLRRTCLLVLESAAPLLGMAEPPEGGHPVSSEIKQQAKAIADEWKAKLAEVDLNASNGYSLEAQAFLQLLATFSIASEFDEDELCKLVIAVSRRRQAPEVCRSIGLTNKMPGVVEALVSGGRLIDAVHFTQAFRLTESFPPVPLLKEYLKNVKGSQENSVSTGAVASKKEPNPQELGAIRAVIKCVEEYKLQDEYPLEPLKKRVSQLEKAKYDKKRMGDPTKPQAKKPRANAVYGSRKPVIPFDNRQLPPAVYDERGLYPGGAERYPERYSYPAPPAYEVASHVPYGQQATAQRPYHYPDERVPPPSQYSASSNYGSYMGTAYQAPPSNYGNYMGTGAQPASSNYGGYIGTGAQSSHQPYM